MVRLVNKVIPDGLHTRAMEYTSTTSFDWRLVLGQLLHTHIQFARSFHRIASLHVLTFDMFTAPIRRAGCWDAQSGRSRCHGICGISFCMSIRTFNLDSKRLAMRLKLILVEESVMQDGMQWERTSAFASEK